jgi:ATP-dependent Clp protease ATP-binding subunit ClpX
VYFDEFDKVSEQMYGRKEGSVGGVELQQEFLALLEDKERVITRTGYEAGEKHQLLNTANIMFIFSGSFAGIENIIERRAGEKKSSLGFRQNADKDNNKQSILHQVTFDDVIKFGIIPELAGRIGFIGVLDKLTKNDLISIMKSAKGNILNQYNNFFLYHFDKLVIKEEVYELIAEEVVKRNIGARALNGVIIELLQDMLFKAPNEFEEVFTVDKDYFYSKFN